MLETLIQIIHVLVALFMVLVVLVQGGNQGGFGAAFGGGNSSGVFGATGATTFLGKLTYGAAFIFMLTSITLTVMQGKSGHIGLSDKLKAAGGVTQPATTPGEATPAAKATDSVPASEPAKSSETAPAAVTEPAKAVDDAKSPPPATESSGTPTTP